MVFGSCKPFFTLVVVACAVECAFPNEDYAAWQYSIPVRLNTTSSGANVAGNVINFPVLIRLNLSNFHCFATTKAGGADIRFAKANGQHLSYQIERWVDGANNNDTAEIWVKIDTVFGNNSAQYILMYRGNAAAVDSSNGPGVFDTANGFRGVWHLPESGAIGTVGLYKDATAIGNNGDDSISATGKTGIIGLGQQFNGNGDYIPTHRWVTTLCQGDFVVSFWVYLIGNGGGILSKMQDGAWDTFGQEELYFGDGTTNLNVNGRYPSWVGYARDYDISETQVGTGAWHHVAFSWKYTGDSSGVPEYYIDGVPVGLSYKGHIAAYNDPIGSTVNIGRQNYNESKVNFSGYLDEFRIDTTVRSADWIKLCYQNQQANQTLVSLTCDSSVKVFTKSALWLLDGALQPLNDTITIDTTVFYVVVEDKDRDINPKAKDTVSVKIKNPSTGDSLIVSLFETGDSTGVFRTASSVSIVYATTGANLISMSDGDKIWITYADPYEPTDVSQAILISKAAFPVATRGWLLDTNGDGTVDKAVIMYDKVLPVLPDSITVFFPDQTKAWTVKAGQGSIVMSGNLATLTFSGTFPSKTTSFSSAAGGTGISYLNDGGNVKKSVFPLADSVGPVILNAQVVERLAPGVDTLYVAFSEAVRPASLIGQSLIIIKDGNPFIIAIDTARALTATRFAVVCNAADPQPLAGDSLRINAAGPLCDMPGNPAHPRNPAVIITLKQIPSSITAAYYVDRDSRGGADGLVDTAIVRFNKKVNIAGLSFTIDWGGNVVALNVGGDTLSYIGTDSLTVGIALRLVFPDTGFLKTSGTMMLTARFVDFPGETRTGVVADSAAAVIDNAVYIFNSSDMGGCDTLVVSLSEPATENGADPFIDSSIASATRYSLTLSPIDSKGTILRFCSVPGATLPQSGDLLWINPGNTIVDMVGNAQKNPNNRKVALKVIRPTTLWKVYVTPNPFSPGSDGMAVDTVIIAPIKRSFYMPLVDARLSIFDIFGNFIYKGELSAPHHGDKGYYFTWDGRNKNGRLVGSGVYWAVITVSDRKGNDVSSVNKLRIGVRR